MTDQLKDSTVGTVRTAYHTTLLTAVILMANKIFGWNITLADAVPFLPAIAVAVGVVYRASIAVSKKWPVLGNILFGINKPPEYPPITAESPT